MQLFLWKKQSIVIEGDHWITATSLILGFFKVNSKRLKHSSVSLLTWAVISQQRRRLELFLRQILFD
jgi:hypothetical protein